MVATLIKTDHDLELAIEKRRDSVAWTDASDLLEGIQPLKPTGKTAFHFKLRERWINHEITGVQYHQGILEHFGLCQK